MGKPRKARKQSTSSEEEEKASSKSPEKNASKLIRIPGVSLSIDVSKKEMKFRKDLFPDAEAVKKLNLKCTACSKNISAFIFSGKYCNLHPALDVLLCKECENFYGDGVFSCDSDGDEKYCRWCAQGGQLFICDICNCSFCKSCAKRNLSRSKFQEMSNSDNWKCFVCEPTPIYEIRAQAWAAQEVYESNKHGKDKNKTPKLENRRSKKKSGSEDESKEQKKRREKRSSTAANDSSSNQSSKTAKQSSTNKKYVKVGVKFLDSLMRDILEFSKLIVTRTTKIHAYCINKSEVNTCEDILTTTEKIKKFLENLHENISNFQEQLDKNTSAFKNIIQPKSDVVSDSGSVKQDSIDASVNSDTDTKVNVDTSEKENEKSMKAEDVIKNEDEDGMITDSDNNVSTVDTKEKSNEKKECSDISSEKVDNEINCTKSEKSKISVKQKHSEEITRNEKEVTEEKESSKEFTDDDNDDSKQDESKVNENKDVSDSDKSLIVANNVSPSESSTKKLKKRSKNSASSNDESADEEMEKEHTESDKVIEEDTTELKFTDEKSNNVVKKENAKCDKNKDSSDSDDESSILGIDDSPVDSGKKKKLKKKKKKNQEKSKNSASSNDESEDEDVKKEKHSDNENTDDEIRRLVNMESLKRSRPSSNSEHDDESFTQQKKKKKKEHKSESDENEKATDVLEILKKSDGEEVNEDEPDREKLTSDTKTNDAAELYGLDFARASEVVTENEMIKQILLMNSTSSSSVESDDETSKLVSMLEEGNKKKKNKAENDDKDSVTSKQSGSSSKDDKEDKDEDEDDVKSDEKLNKKNKSGSISDANSEDIFEPVKPKSKWKRNKLLTIKLSDTDTSDDERREAKWLERHNKSKSNNKSDNESSSSLFEKPLKNRRQVKRKKKNLVGSDSDELKISLSDESDSSSSSEILKGKSKKKRSKNSSSSVIELSSEEDKKKKKRRKRIKAPVDSSSNSGGSSKNSDEDDKDQTPGKGRKNIRKVMDDTEIADSTKSAAKDEQERRQRIMDRQLLYNKLYEIKDTGDKKLEKLVLDFDPETKKELVVVDPELVKKMKPHQAEGVKFMWDAAFESVDRFKKGKGGGCILAHCMGLGKTFQVISLVHTLLTHECLDIKRVLVVCPLSTVLNWFGEFENWLKDVEDSDDIELHHLVKEKNSCDRAYRCKHWCNGGGVMILGYEMFRNLTNEKSKAVKKKEKAVFHNALIDPGPDLVVCDEGHMLKNEASALSKAMNRIKTLRRIVLTGTPLQNNLIEYHCMVQFVKPKLLGTKKEFSNRFVNPITNGQFIDSTERDVKVMKRRAHVLHKMLDGLVQRRDYNVLTPYLPPKHEYVLSIRLSEVQIKLYRTYLDTQVGKTASGRMALFADFQSLSRIWSHPLALKYSYEKNLAKKDMETEEDSEGSLRDFVVDESDASSTPSGSSSRSGSESNKKSGSESNKKSQPVKMTRAARQKLGEDAPEIKEETPVESASSEWWSSIVEPNHFEDINVSPKLVLLLRILSECEQIGDKVLIFSQSLYSLDLIEEFLAKIDEATQENEIKESLGNHVGSWSKGLDYFRLDGSTSGENRTHFIKSFNKESNTRARLFLISTRAGGLGINLTSANRVIIFDVSWNPSHDVQSIFRIYRFGQKKPCYIYRFIAQGTMEEKVYERQIAKLSLSQRVIDEQQVHRHFSHSDLQELYTFSPAEKQDDSTPMLPKDRLMAEMLQNFSNIIYKCHEHDSLLDHVEEEELNEEERKAAWDDFENEKKRPVFTQVANFQGLNVGSHLQDSAWLSHYSQTQFQFVQKIREAIAQKHPNMPAGDRMLIEQRILANQWRDIQNQQIAARMQQLQRFAAPGQQNFRPVNMPLQQQFTMQRVLQPYNTNASTSRAAVPSNNVNTPQTDTTPSDGL